MLQELYTPEQLAQMHNSLWECVLQFANLSAVQERNRIARDLHDSLGHALTGLNLQLQTAIKLCQLDPNQAQDFLTEAHRLAAIATKEVRQSVQALRNDVSETQSIEELIEILVNDFYQTTGILAKVDTDITTAISQNIVISIYRIIQEALNNIRKYAQASEVKINLHTTLDNICFQIKDNGRGFDSEQISSGHGLRGMQERVAILQGSFNLESQPGAGCCITVKIPIQLSQTSTENYMPCLSEISEIAEISVNQASSIMKNNHFVKISEWQPLNLDECNNFTFL
ncbi:MAG: sensor histidine kinase [Cyanobacteria bacterium P01_H01_bin.150]